MTSLSARSSENTPSIDGDSESLDFHTAVTRQTGINDHLWGHLEPLDKRLEQIDFFRITPDICIGRSILNNICLPTATISNFHCSIVWNGRSDKHYGVSIQDIDSSNGTYINGVRMPQSAWRTLKEGNIIGFGRGLTVPSHDKITRDYRYIFREGPTVSEESNPVKEHYELHNELGRGAYGVVHRAMSHSTGAWYAVKVMRYPSLAEPDELKEQIKSYASEIEVMKRLKHPNICQIFEVYHGPNDVALVLDLADNGNLTEYMMKRESGIDEDIARDIAFQICHAISFCHLRAITHRDLKPDNILIFTHDSKTSPPRIKVADFGVAKIASEESSLRTRCGTSLYMAPEVHKKGLDPDESNESYTELADAFSIGAIVFNMLTSRQHFVGKISKTTPTRERRIAWSALPVTVSKDAVSFMYRLLETEPQFRMAVRYSFLHDWLEDHQPYHDIRFTTEPSEVTADIPASSEKFLSANESYVEKKISQFMQWLWADPRPDPGTHLKFMEYLSQEDDQDSDVPGAFVQSNRGKKNKRSRSAWSDDEQLKKQDVAGERAERPPKKKERTMYD